MVHSVWSNVWAKESIDKVSSASAADYVLECAKFVGISSSFNISSLQFNSPKKKAFHNLVNLLGKCTEIGIHDPTFQRFYFDNPHLLTAISQSLDVTYEPALNKVFLGKTKTVGFSRRMSDLLSLEYFFSNLFELTQEKIPSENDNSLMSSVYYPDSFLTHYNLPPEIPPDYRSNFFFEICAKELSTCYSSINCHPYTNNQINRTAELSIDGLLGFNTDLDLCDSDEIELVDNIRGYRVHGPLDDHSLPGSFFVLGGGHHRARRIYEEYLKGNISGNQKVIVQKVTEKDIVHLISESEIQNGIQYRSENRLKEMPLTLKTPESNNHYV